MRCVITPYALIATCVFSGSAARAQISPGELSAAHASLEGMDNCTKCHALGKEVPNDKCLLCHSEIRSRLAQRMGYHATLTGRACVECHNEHHGREFRIIRFDVKNFDHRQAGYLLEGKHRVLDCAQCHTPSHITSSDVRANKALLSAHTYLGLPTECRMCHSDQHKGQLNAQCQVCHSADGWKPASHFAHDSARFRLTGRHQQVDCTRCHRPMRTDATTVQYVGLSFERCTACHADPHAGRFAKPCESCHSTAGWQTGAARSFDHASTRFPLRGRHAGLRCELCHLPVRGADGTLKQNFAVKSFQHCADCHSDAHRGEFSAMKEKGACEGCHSEEGWSQFRFDHAIARYPLRGRHQSVACNKCHGSGSAGPQGVRLPPDCRVKKFSACMDCHEDAHGEQFRRRKDGGACESCHTVDGFLPASYTPAEHSVSAFPLAGAHAAVPCARCHLADIVRARSTRQFIWPTGVQCESCHRDPHGGQFARTCYAGCASCHSPSAWNSLAFNHDQTKFPLTGKHVKVACAECHKAVAQGGAVRQYSGTPSRCVDCHPQMESQPLGSRRL